MNNYSQNRQICEEYKGIKICKVPSGQYNIYREDTLIMGGFTLAKFVSQKNYIRNNEYKFIICKTSVYDEDCEEYIALWHLFDILGNKLLGSTECKSIFLPYINVRDYNENSYGKPHGSVYGDGIFIIENRHWTSDSHYSLIKSDGQIIYNSSVLFDAFQFGNMVIINHVSDEYNAKSKRVYGVVDMEGQVIVPFVYSSIKPILDKSVIQTKHRIPLSYTLPQKIKCPKESAFLLELENGKTMFVDSEGFPVIKNGKETFVFHHKRIWIGDFKESIAPIYDKYEGFLTLNNEPVIFSEDGKPIILSSEYKVASKIDDNIAIVLKDKEYLYDLNKEKEIDNGYGDIQNVCNNVFIADNTTLIILNNNYEIVIEQSYPFCKPLIYNGELFLLVGDSTYEYNRKYGILDKNGLTILGLLYKKIIITNDGFFECTQEIIERKNWQETKKEVTLLFSKDSIEFCKIEDGYLPKPSGYNDVKYIKYSMFSYMKNGKYGVINVKGDVIIEPKYDYISEFAKGFALVYISVKNEYDESWGVINTKGDEIISPLANHFSSIAVLNNGWFACTGEDWKTSVYNTSGKKLWDSPMGKVNSLKGTAQFFSVGELDHIGVVDIYGKVIIPLEYHEVIFLDSLLFIVIKRIENWQVDYRFGNYEDNSYESRICGIKNIYNDTIVKLEYEEIESIPELPGFYMAKNDRIEQCQLLPEQVNVETQLNYSLLTSSGKVMYSARKIRYIGNNFFSVRKDGKEGIIDLSGNVIVPIKFEYVGNFYNDSFWVSNEYSYTGSFAFKYGENVEGELIRKVNLKGELSANNNGDTIWIPSEYDWATGFVEQLSIVRKDNLLGVIDSSCNTIIDTNYDNILILENHTILVNKLKEDKSILKGVFDWEGNEIIPVEYNHIKHISQNRYKIGHGDYFVIVNQKGEKLTEEFITIQDFKSLYDGTQERLCAIVYKNKELKDNGKWYFKDGGVIDIDGNEILPYTYDKVTLYPPHYALCVRKGIRSIADLSNGKQIRYPNLKIKHTWGIDVLGRCVFSEDCTYDSHEEEWKDGTRGVFDINGVLIPSGKYSQIILEDSGLMIVGVNNPDSGNDNKNDEYSLNLLWGIVDQAGKEIISPKYSKISQIKGDYLLVYKGKNSTHCNRMYEGIWAIINMSEELIKEFEYDFEAQSYLRDLDKGEGVENCPNNTSTYYYYEVPKVLLSEAIKRKETRSPVYYDDNQFDDDDPHRKYGGYNGWDDNTIDEAFDGNPELTWNID